MPREAFFDMGRYSTQRLPKVLHRAPGFLLVPLGHRRPSQAPNRDFWNFDHSAVHGWGGNGKDISLSKSAAPDKTGEKKVSWGRYSTSWGARLRSRPNAGLKAVQVSGHYRTQGAPPEVELEYLRGISLLHSLLSGGDSKAGACDGGDGLGSYPGLVAGSYPKEPLTGAGW